MQIIGSAATETAFIMRNENLIYSVPETMCPAPRSQQVQQREEIKKRVVKDRGGEGGTFSFTKY